MQPILIVYCAHPVFHNFSELIYQQCILKSIIYVYFPLVLKLFPESNSKKLTWFDARDYCRAIGGDLLSIHSQAEQNRLPFR